MDLRPAPRRRAVRVRSARRSCTLGAPAPQLAALGGAQHAGAVAAHAVVLFPLTAPEQAQKEPTAKSDAEARPDVRPDPVPHRLEHVQPVAEVVPLLLDPVLDCVERLGNAAARASRSRAALPPRWSAAPPPARVRRPAHRPLRPAASRESPVPFSPLPVAVHACPTLHVSFRAASGPGAPKTVEQHEKNEGGRPPRGRPPSPALHPAAARAQGSARLWRAASRSGGRAGTSTTSTSSAAKTRMSRSPSRATP